MDSEGISLRLTKPQRRRKTGEPRRASMVARVWGWLYTALATKARAKAWRSLGFRPNLFGSRGKFFDLDQLQDAD